MDILGRGYMLITPGSLRVKIKHRENWCKKKIANDELENLRLEF